MSAMASTSRRTIDADNDAINGKEGQSSNGGTSDGPSTMSSYIEQRRTERLRRDPHYAHPLRRVYIGPSPIGSSQAPKVAAVMRRDHLHQRGEGQWYQRHGDTHAGKGHPDAPAFALGVVAGTGSIVGATMGWPAQAGTSGSATKEARDSVPGVADDAWDLRHSKVRRSVTVDPRREAEQVSRLTRRHASSSAPKAAPNESGGILRHVRSAENSSLSRTEDENERNLAAFRQNPSSAPSSAQGNMKFAQEQGARTIPAIHRSKTEGLPPASSENGPPLPLLDEPVVEEEGWEDMNSGQNQSNGCEAKDGHLRQRGSQRSLGLRAPNAGPSHVPRLRDTLQVPSESQRGSVIIHSQDGSVESQALEQGRLAPPSEMLGASHFGRSEELRARTRDKFSQSKAGQARRELLHDLKASREENQDHIQRAPSFRRIPSSASARPQRRDISRQSRVSHASTMNSLGTRFSEGSFGASGGFRARLLRAFGANNDKKSRHASGISRDTQRTFSSHAGGGGGPSLSAVTNRRRASSRAASLSAQAIRAIARSHGGRAHVRGGVVAGAVGTSAGGTKWVGQSFEVGKRFRDASEAYESQFLAAEYRAKVKETRAQETSSKVPSVPQGQKGSATSAASDSKQTNSTSKKRPSAERSPSQVLDAFARRAETADQQQPAKAALGTSQDERAQKQSALGLSDAVARPSDEARNQSTPALVGSSFGSDASDASPNTPPRNDRNANARIGHDGSMDDKRAGQDAASTDALGLQGARASRESLLSMSEDNIVQGDIENRAGWADVMGFINGKHQRKRPTVRLGNHTRQSASESAADVQAYTHSPKKAESALEEMLPEGASTHGEGLSPPARPNLQREYSQAASSAAATFVSALESTDDGRRAVAESDSSKAVTAQQALKHPDPPLAAESKFPEATHELTRRVSNPGMDPAGKVNDAASDHEVIMQKALDDASDDKKEIDTNMLQRRATELDLPANEIVARHPRKTVQFQTGSDLKAPHMVGGRERERLRRGDAKPASPLEVLARDSSPNEKSYDSTHGWKEADDHITIRSVLKRDRMLVRVAWTPSEDLPRELTEREAPKYPLHFGDPFREYMVVFRMGRLELWDDPTWAMWLTGRSDQLKLHLVAPLKPGRTFVSIYSPIDNIFCVSFQLGTGHHRGLLNLRKSGTHVWLFDARSTTNAADWVWELWRELGGHIPPVLDISLPVLGVKIQIPIPDQIDQSTQVLAKKGLRPEGSLASSGYIVAEELAGEGYKLISRNNVVSVVEELASKVSQWSELAHRLKERGIQFGLAWRIENNLSWVKYDATADGQVRDWAVLVGSILCNRKQPSTLEFRAAVHYPDHVTLAGCARLEEPPGIEGFLWRVKAVSGALTRVYVSTHDGLLFVIRPSRACPPERFVAADPHSTDFDGRSRRRSSAGSAGDESLGHFSRRIAETLIKQPTSLDDLDQQLAAYRSLERRRQLEQVSHADGYVDVRDFCLIRCLGDKSMSRRPDSENNEEDNYEHHDEGRSRSPVGTASTHGDDSDAEDVGGEEGYELAEDRASLKQARQIEITMANGRSIRLEAYSHSVACEWVCRLNAISRYWKRREKVDALDMMNASGYDSRHVMRHEHVRANFDPSTTSHDIDRIAPLLGNIWNWCVVDGCRGIVRSGRLFTKKKPYSAFTSRYCVLVGGRILTYNLMTSNRTARGRQNAGIFHKRQETVIHLRDAYVYSGKLTEHMLVNGRSSGAGALTGTGGSASATARHTLPRIYGDGLLSVDEDEDCTFVIRYRPQRVQSSAVDAQLAAAAAGQRPPAASGVDPTFVSVSLTAPAATRYTAPDAATAPNQSLRVPPPPPSTSTPLLQDKTVNHIALRARSRLERDLWVWAIDCERERLIREDRTREERLRNQGQTPYYKSH